MKKLLFSFILPALFYPVLYLWCWTLRVHNLSPEIDAEIRNCKGGYVLALWHSRIFYIFYHFRNLKNLTALVSPSVDGDLIARLCQWMGFQVARGSSYKNTFAGSREVLRDIKKGRCIGIVADGSRGPRHQAQLGAIQLARITGTPVFPVTYHAEPNFEFNSWDRFILPRPFSRVILKFDTPITVPRKADDAMLAAKQKELTDRLNQITADCENEAMR